MDFQNHNCDGAHCTDQNSKVKLVPYGNADSNMILCFSCFNHEMQYRKLQNRNGKKEKILNWEDLKPYN